MYMYICTHLFPEVCVHGSQMDVYFFSPLDFFSRYIFFHSSLKKVFLWRGKASSLTRVFLRFKLGCGTEYNSKVLWIVLRPGHWMNIQSSRE